MGKKAVASVPVISVLLVVGIVVGAVVVVYKRGSGSGNGNGTGNSKAEEKISESIKMLESLCGVTPFKENCMRTLGPVAQNESAAPQAFVEAGMKVALEEMNKAFNFTDTFIPKANDTKHPNMTMDAIHSCKNYYDLSMDRLGELVRYAQHREAYDNEFLVWYIRLSLSDLITFATACYEGFTEVYAPELGSLMKDGVRDGEELTSNMLSIVTSFNKALASINVTQLAGPQLVLQLVAAASSAFLLMEMAIPCGCLPQIASS